ncbi:MAG: hypothetical protein ISP90_02145 [Nevskia sp.]|nr:hypothetical protein [Nevskia sp.]
MSMVIERAHQRAARTRASGTTMAAVDLPDFEIEKSRYVLIPPGRYELRFLNHETAVMFMAPKLVMWFSVVNFGEYFEKIVPRFYNVRRLIGKPGRGGRFMAKAGGEFILDYYSMFKPGTRLDRLSFDPWRSNIIHGNVGTVTVTGRQRALPEPLQYSVIKSFAGVKQL